MLITQDHCSRVWPQLPTLPHYSSYEIEVEFAEYFTTFPWLIKLIDQINQNNLIGSNLMNFIKTLETQCGAPEKLKIFSKILELMYSVWIRKLVAWLIQGIVYDPHHEFMISLAESTEEASLYTQLTSDKVDMFFAISKFPISWTPSTHQIYFFQAQQSTF